VFGFTVSLTALAVFMALPADDRPDDVTTWLTQMSSSAVAAVAVALMIPVTPTFNATGNTITKHMSATTRMVLDTLRNVVVWCFSMVFFGERFNWVQLLGFVVLVFGTAVYKNLIELPIGFFRHKEMSHIAISDLEDSLQTETCHEMDHAMEGDQRYGS
jgi:drug/metabolite transporter (DMT)-like permease